MEDVNIETVLIAARQGCLSLMWGLKAMLACYVECLEVASVHIIDIHRIVEQGLLSRSPDSFIGGFEGARELPVGVDFFVRRTASE